MNQSINFFSNLDNDFVEYPTLNECTKAVKEYVSKEIYNNHLDLLAENGIHLHTPNDVDRDVQNLFISKYVEHGVHGGFDGKLDKVIREQLPLLHQYLQYFGDVYAYVRHYAIWG